jgi:hypothetical protein
MQTDSTHTMITRSRVPNQLATVKPATVKPATVKPATVKPATVKPNQLATKLPLSPTTRSHVLRPSSDIQEPRMVTRSSNNTPRYDVDIDFDEASEAWRANKKSIGNGMFKYVGMRTRSKM